MKAPALGALLLVTPLAVCVASSGTAHAEVPRACLSAPLDGQKLQRDGKLLAARDMYAACAVPTCPAEIVHDCLDWLHQVDGATPSVVLAARDAGGIDLKDVQVSIDGGAPAMTGTRAVRLDPGSHTFAFRRAGAEQTKQVVLREGEQNREVLAVFLPPESASSRPVPVIAWAAGGVGVAAMGAFAVFGAIGLTERGANHCDSGCPAEQKSAVDSKFLVSDVALGVGLVALAAATWFYFTRPAVRVQADAVSLERGLVQLRF